MLSISIIIFLGSIVLLSLYIQIISLKEGASIIKDPSGNTVLVDGDYIQDGNNIIRDINGDEVSYQEIQTNQVDTNTIKDASGNMKIPDGSFPAYHESANSLAEKDPRIKSGNMIVRDMSGNMIEVPWTGKQTNINYNESSYFRYQPSTFVPNYEDSVYLSRTTGLSTTKPIETTASKMGGFCHHNKGSSIKIEQDCGKLEKDACASTSCCVLLGGSRCVAGNENGPTMKANYSDITIKNRDHYFYQGKCYGNCPN